MYTSFIHSLKLFLVFETQNYTCYRVLRQLSKFEITNPLNYVDTQFSKLNAPYLEWQPFFLSGADVYDFREGISRGMKMVPFSAGER